MRVLQKSERIYPVPTAEFRKLKESTHKVYQYRPGEPGEPWWAARVDIRAH